jgi:tRNA-uridine 2-sulfurtransferase
MNKKAIIAMSGGVDSSVAALIMQQQNYEIIGSTLRLYDNNDIGLSNSHTCCSLSDVEDARRVAYKLGIPYYVFNFISKFHESVIRRFINGYCAGKTPNPCIDCNRYIKFAALLKRAQEINFDYIVTGHYARIEKNGVRYLLKKGVDAAKDQSYVLYNLTQEQLAHTLFPLGGMQKFQVRDLADRHGFVNAHKHDSQDLCFVPDGNYSGFIERYLGKSFPRGNFINAEGKILGTHNGIINYTIGQRKKLGLAAGEPCYVCEKNALNNTIKVGNAKSLFSNKLIAHDLNMIAMPKLNSPMRLKVKTRYRQVEQWAVAEQLSEDTLQILFDEPQRAITSGQAAVLYDGDVVIGGGTIE